MSVSNNLVEGKYGHGAIKSGLIRRVVRRVSTPKIGKAAIPFDWNKGYDIEDYVSLSRKNQGQSFSCSGQAGSYFIEASRKLSGISDVVSAKSIYSIIAAPGGGATVPALDTQIGAHGANLESAVPSYLKGSIPLSESAMIDKGWITPTLTDEALTRGKFTPIQVSLNLDSLAEAIRDCGGIIIELGGQNNGTWGSQFPTLPSKKNPNEIWYHYIFFKGAKILNGKKYLIGVNSWGTEVGVNGVQWFDETYVTSGYFVTAISFIKDSELQPTEDNHSIWANVWRFFQDSFGWSSLKMA